MIKQGSRCGVLCIDTQKIFVKATMKKTNNQEEKATLEISLCLMKELLNSEYVCHCDYKTNSNIWEREGINFCKFG